MPVYCDECAKKIPPYTHGGLTDKAHADLVRKITKLSYNDFQHKPASGGVRWEAKIGKHRICLFIDSSDNARIMIEGTGRWLASLDFKDETPEAMLEKLQVMLKS